jgi:hypothetical protein
MTFGFSLMAIGSILMLSGYEKKTIGEILSQLQVQPQPGETAFSSYLRSGGSAVSSAVLGGTGGSPANTTGAPKNIAGALAKGVAAASSIVGFEYAWGGGHNPQFAPSAAGEHGRKGYDCSGAVSFVLHAMGLLKEPLVSGQLASWGEAGAGKFLTVYANPTHTFMKIGGAWFGTGSDKEAVRGGPAWGNHDPELSAYSVRHPKGF